MANKSIEKRIIERIISKADPDKIILFGSRAQKKHQENSDYDICVLKKDLKNKRKLSKDLYLALLGLKVPVDLIVDTPSFFEKNKNNPFFIYSEINSNGKILYEKK